MIILQISKAQYDKVWNYIEEGKKAGAKVVIGGEKLPGPGYYVPPTIFVDVTPDMKIVKEEIFGPVLCALSAACMVHV
jgi:aldehyde dehydrogenase (NAD+)